MNEWMAQPKFGSMLTMQTNLPEMAVCVQPPRPNIAIGDQERPVSSATTPELFLMCPFVPNLHARVLPVRIHFPLNAWTAWYVCAVCFVLIVSLDHLGDHCEHEQTSWVHWIRFQLTAAPSSCTWNWSFGTSTPARCLVCLLKQCAPGGLLACASSCEQGEKYSICEMIKFDIWNVDACGGGGNTRSFHQSNSMEMVNNSLTIFAWIFPSYRNCPIQSLPIAIKPGVFQQQQQPPPSNPTSTRHDVIRANFITFHLRYFLPPLHKREYILILGSTSSSFLEDNLLRLRLGCVWNIKKICASISECFPFRKLIFIKHPTEPPWIIEKHPKGFRATQSH